MVTGGVRIRLLGRFGVHVDGCEVPSAAFGGYKARLLLTVLAVHHDHYVSRDALADVLWGDAQPADPAANLSVLVNRARRALGDTRLIATGPRGYALTAACTVDAERFAEHVNRGRGAAAEGAQRAALQEYRSAFTHWAGPPLAEQADDLWAQEYRTELLGLRQSALEEAADLAVHLGETILGVAYASEAVEAEPLREVATLRLATAFDRGGDQAAALQAITRLRRRLRDDLGIDPAEEITALQARLLTRRSQGTAQSALPAPSAAPDLPFLGRQALLEELLSEINGAGSPVVVVAAPAGAGKTRLLAELASRAQRPVIAARTFLPERAEPWSLARILLIGAFDTHPGLVRALPRHAVRALLDVVPDLDRLVPAVLEATSAPPLEAATRRALVLEAGVRLLAANPNALLLADDLQWADPDSLTLLSDVLHREPTLRCVLAYRSDEAPPGGALRTALAAVATARPVRSVELPPLTDADLASILEPQVASAVAESTAGLPFAVTAVVRELARRQALLPDEHGGWRSATATTVDDAAALGREGRRRLVRSSVDRHPAAEREVLVLLCLLARQAPTQFVASATARSPSSAMESLTALAAGGLVRLGERGWATSHDLVRETVTDALDGATRGRMHALLAAALTAASGDAGEIARHQAGAGDADAAARSYAAAARRLIDGTDDAGLTELVETGLGLAGTGDVRRELLEVRAGLRTRLGDLAAARADLREAMTGATGPTRSRLLAQLAMLYCGAEDLDRAARVSELAVVDAGTDPAAKARALEVAAIVDMNRDAPERAHRRFADALALYRARGDAAGTARILDARAMATFLDGGIAPALQLFAQVADLFTDIGDLLHVVTPLSTAGHALVFAADPAAGLDRTTKALDLARSLGHLEGITYALWHSAEALAALDRAGEALNCAQEALSVAEKLAHRGWTATALRALGIAYEASGEDDAAADAFARSLTTATGFSLFSSWAASRLALCLVRHGDLDAAAPLVDRALREGPPLAHYEARLAEAELARARDDPGAATLAATVAERARAGGHLACLPRLQHATAG